jgi:ABC-type multidrug transport system ATPase subunit
MISGSITPSSGDIIYKNESGVISADDIFHYLAIATPYLELVEELTFDEHLVFQQQFKPFYQNRSLEDIASITGLDKSREKQIRNFSSGMKQRLKLALAVLSDAPILLLDEPTTNLDQKGFEWYLDLMKNYASNRLVIVLFKPRAGIQLLFRAA